ncbi:hypothetical protein MCEGE10_00181 [Flavobacteriaceae bacterium]
MKKIVFLFLLVSNISFSQTPQELEDLGLLIDDALFFSNKYITPAADAAIYQATSGWMTSPKKRKIWDVTLGIHFNAFLVPNKDREFVINNSDFTFFQIENASSATVPTALGNNNQVNLIGQIGTTPVSLKTPEGVNEEVVLYPHFSGSVALWCGTELVVKYAPKTKLKKGDYQVYGFGFKHNFDQYFKALQAKKINLAGLVCYSNENISFDFIDPQTSIGTLGINRITGLVDTWQLQFNASKEYKRFEFATGIIVNVSDVKYKFTGDVPPNQAIPTQSLFNERLKEIYKTRTNFLGEVSCRYKINKMYLQSTFAFGKFVNSNIALQYEF